MPVIIELRTAGEPRPALQLADLLDTGEAKRFYEAMTAARGAWAAICALEQDLLDMETANRSAGVSRGWEIVVGPCPRLEPVPGYLGWGQVSAWLEDDGYALTLEEGAVVVRAAAALREELDAAALVRCAFGHASGQCINHGMQTVHALEAAFGEGETGSGARA